MKEVQLQQIPNLVLNQLSLVIDTLDILSSPVSAETQCRKLLRNWQQKFNDSDADNSSVAYGPLNVYIFTLKESGLIFILNYMNKEKRGWKQLLVFRLIVIFFVIFCHLFFRSVYRVYLCTKQSHFQTQF